MTIMIIGGAGYIGSHVARRLLDNGDTVVVYDNLSTGKTENLFEDARFVQGDILDKSRLDAAMAEGVEAIVHLAAFKAAGESMIEPEKYAENNISGTINILNSMCRHGVKRFVFSSSAAVYGDPEYLPVDEEHPTFPVNFYGFTKLEIERILGWYDELKDVRFAALRYFNAAGYDADGRIRGIEKNPANLLPVIMETAIGVREKLSVFGDDYDTRDGTGVRDYIHVTDLADAHHLALNHVVETGESLTVNLGSGEGVSVYEALKMAREVTGREIPAEATARRPGDPAELVASSRLAERALDWKACRSDIGNLIRTMWNVYANAGST